MVSNEDLPVSIVFDELFFIKVYFGIFDPLGVGLMIRRGHSLQSEPRTKAIEHPFESAYGRRARFGNHANKQLT